MNWRARIASAASVAALLCLPTEGPARAQSDGEVQPEGNPQAGPAGAAKRAIDIEIPDDFVPATRNAAGAAATLNSNPHLGGLKFAGTVEARMRKDGPVTVFITTMISDEKVAYPDAAIHSEFEQLRTAPERGSLDDKHVETVSWKTDLVEGGVRADLHWRHLAYETETRARALAYRVGSGHLHFVQVECIHPLEKPEARPLGALCDQVLATMAIPEHAGAQAGAQAGDGAGSTASGGQAGIAAIPAGNNSAAGDAPGAGDPDQPVVSEERPPGNLPQLTLRDPGDLDAQPLPAMKIKKPKKRDYRQLLYLLGGILLAVGFYLTTRSRNAARDDDYQHRQDDAPQDDDDSEDNRQNQRQTEEKS